MRVAGNAASSSGSQACQSTGCGRARTGRERGADGAQARGRAGVEVHALAGRVDDERAPRSQAAEDVVHAGRHLRDAPGRRDAVVRVPHVTHDDGGPRGFPVPMEDARVVWRAER
ncbi:MAG: hypothetical protein M3282_03820 [Gemmatimonadota bacterium]|nr:hypothetical protein [Gemmatimonadota bacterium]